MDRHVMWLHLLEELQRIFFFFSLHMKSDTGASDHYACTFY